MVIKVKWTAIELSALNSDHSLCDRFLGPSMGQVPGRVPDDYYCNTLPLSLFCLCCLQFQVQVRTRATTYLTSLQTKAVHQIRRGNRDSLRILSHISP